MLLHIYDFAPHGTIYLPNGLKNYQTRTPVVVALSDADSDRQESHLYCVNNGYCNWLNAAVVSDTCDSVATQTEETLVAAFNEDCRHGNWLHRMMNYRQE